MLQERRVSVVAHALFLDDKQRRKMVTINESRHASILLQLNISGQSWCKKCIQFLHLMDRANKYIYFFFLQIFRYQLNCLHGSLILNLNMLQASLIRHPVSVIFYGGREIVQSFISDDFRDF